MKKLITTLALAVLLNAAFAQLTYTGVSNKTIANYAGTITLLKCSNIIITDCVIANSPTQKGVYLYQCSNVTIFNCSFTNVSTGVSVDHCTNNIVVANCFFKNMMGPFPAGQAVQFNNFNGYGGNVSHNTIFNYPGASNPEDCISLYQSNGTSDSPILVSYNQIRGGGPSTSGGGVMLGDGGGSWQIAKNNSLVDPGQYGVAVSGGIYMSLIGNLIYGKQQPFTNVGLYTNTPGILVVCSGNRVFFTNKAGVVNNSWNAPVVYDRTLGVGLVPGY